MRRLRGSRPGFACNCGNAVTEEDLKMQVLEAVRRLQDQEEEIRRRIDLFREKLGSEELAGGSKFDDSAFEDGVSEDSVPGDRSSEADARIRWIRAKLARKIWQLENLLPENGMPGLECACYLEEDFRARTGHEIGREWNEDALVRIVDRVIAGKEVRFKGGIVVILLVK